MDLFIDHTEEMFQQQCLDSLECLESLPLHSLTSEIKNLENWITYVTKTYDKIDRVIPSAHLTLFQRIMKKFDVIFTAVWSWKICKIYARYMQYMQVIFLLHVNTCSSAPGERPSTTVLHVKTWLFLVVTQKRFNSTPILNSHKVKTENLGLLTLVNIFVCNDKCHQNFGRLAVMIWNDLKWWCKTSEGQHSLFHDWCSAIF